MHYSFSRVQSEQMLTRLRRGSTRPPPKTLQLCSTHRLRNRQKEVPFISRLYLRYPLSPTGGALTRAPPCRPEDERKHFRDVCLPHHSHPPAKNIRSIQLMIAPPFLCISQLFAGIWSQILFYILIFFSLSIYFFACPSSCAIMQKRRKPEPIQLNPIPDGNTINGTGATE